MTSITNNFNLAKNAALNILPLSVATVPWGILCGSLAISAGLTHFQAQLMSLIVFAGAAQLASVSLIAAGGGAASIFSSTFVISSRHLLYSAVFRDEVRNKSFMKRFMIAYFLTDEMFAVTVKYIQEHNHFNTLYSLTAGITFYLIWNLSTLTGILMADLIPNLESFGFEFAIAATFIAIVVPSINNLSTFIAVATSGVSVLALQQIAPNYALIAATLIGIGCGYFSFQEPSIEAQVD